MLFKDKLLRKLPDTILCQRIFKAVVCATACFILCLVTSVRSRLGYQPSMLSLASIMVHPSRRFGGMIQSAIFCLVGLFIGAAWAIFGRFLAREIIGSPYNQIREKDLLTEHFGQYRQALVLLAMFEIIMLFFHGWVRVINPHYFGIMFPLFLIVHFAFLDDLKYTPFEVFEAYIVPFSLGIAISIACNLILFPEFGSAYLGGTALDAIDKLHVTLDSSVQYFIMFSAGTGAVENDNLEHINGSNSSSSGSKSNNNANDRVYSNPSSSYEYAREIQDLKQLLANQKMLKKQISQCQAVLKECTYEISYSYLSPVELKYFFKTLEEMSKYLIAIVNGCQLEFSLLGDFLETGEINESSNKAGIHNAENCEQLIQMLDQVRAPTAKLHQSMSETVYYIKLGVCYAYDVNLNKCRSSRFFNATKEVYKTIDDLNFEEQVKKLTADTLSFDSSWRSALENFASSEAGNDIQGLLLPRDEIFLLSLFILNFKEVSACILKLTTNIKFLVEIKKLRKENSMLWFSGKKIWISFLTSKETFWGWLRKSDTGMNISEIQSLQGARSSAMDNFSVHSFSSQHQNRLKATSLISNPKVSLGSLAKRSGKTLNKSVSLDIEYRISLVILFCLKFFNQYKHHFIFGIQCVMALMLASFPMFIPESRSWYINIRGTWIGFVCILVVEPSIGNTFWVFFLRGVGIIAGASWGYLSYVAAAHQKFPFSEVIVATVGAIPGFYYLLGTAYIKGAIIGLVSLYIVVLATVIPSSIGGSILVNWGKRCLALLYGGLIGLISNLFVFPVHAKDELVAELALACDCCAKMQMLYSSSIEGEKSVAVISSQNYQRFFEISGQGRKALSRAEAYNQAAKTEPSFKGDYKVKSKLYSEMVFLLGEIMSRMENIVFLRAKYGSEIIEQLNFIAYPHRRQVAAAINNIMITIREALNNKSPLPQYLPSAKNSQLKLIAVIREYLSKTFKISLAERPEMESLSSTEEACEEESEDQSGVIQFTAPHKAASGPLTNEYMLKEKLLSWCATSAALEEVIEYIDELVELSRILVGVNEFKYGFLSRSIKYEEQLIEAKEKYWNDAGQRQKEANREGLSALGESKNMSTVNGEPEQQKRKSTNSDGDLDDNAEVSSGSSFSLNTSIEEESLNPVQYTESGRMHPIATIPSYDTAIRPQNSNGANSLTKTKSIDSFRQSSRNFIMRIYSLKQPYKDNALSRERNEESENVEELPLALKRIMLKKLLSKHKKI